VGCTTVSAFNPPHKPSWNLLSHPLQLLTPVVESVLQKDMQRFADYAVQQVGMKS
jgi:hypothetical protein